MHEKILPIEYTENISSDILENALFMQFHPEFYILAELVLVIFFLYLSVVFHNNKIPLAIYKRQQTKSMLKIFIMLQEM